MDWPFRAIDHDGDAGEPLSVSAAAQSSSPEQHKWQERVAEAAYYLAERRGFQPGHEHEDWLEAEKQVRGATNAPMRTRDKADR
jgi:hypothetical protein